MKEFDVVIAGAGPAGSTTAILLGKNKIKTLLLEKQKMPRGKPCGGAISYLTKKKLREIGLLKKLESLCEKKILGIKFVAPNGRAVYARAPEKEEEEHKNSGCFSRSVFDNLLFKEAKKHCTALQAELKEFTRENGLIKVNFSQDGIKKSVRTKILVGADGAQSTVAKALGLKNNDKRHMLIGATAYFSGLNLENYIEIDFLGQILPGYFWVFPLSENKANVGIGMLLEESLKKKINIAKVFKEIIKGSQRKRFAKARQLSPIRAWLLPTASKRQKAFADNCLLVGDAASLIDPVSGEGIGNAMLSASLASETIQKALEKKDYSETTLKEYQKKLGKHIFSEAGASQLMAKAARSKWFLNFLFARLEKKEKARIMLSGMFADIVPKKKILSLEFLRAIVF